jgi:ABC-type transport system involved in Fe-S cluster assembly fused permease/ATPase subunit
LNFETVKYFNAENHEEKRFEIALNAYKLASVNVAKGLVTLNISQSSIISLGLCSTLFLANYFIANKKISVGDFVMFNSFNQ